MEVKLAGMLFGNQNLRGNISQFKAPIPMAIYCKNKAEQKFTGESAEGFSNNLCNEFYPAPADVGKCITKNSVHHINLSEITLQNDFELIHSAHRYAENMFVISVDAFGDLNINLVNSNAKFEVITIKCYFSLIQNSKIKNFSLEKIKEKLSFLFFYKIFKTIVNACIIHEFKKHPSSFSES